MNIAKISEFKTKPLFNQRTKTWHREIKAEKNIEYLNRAVSHNE